MHAASVAARVGRAWFSVIVLTSTILVSVTFLAFALENAPRLSSLLFWFGLAGENNFGAWWSGMLLLVAAAFALDGSATAPGGSPASRGWRALAALLAILSFDEIASLHEYLANSGLGYLAALAVPLFALGCYSLWQLHSGNADRRALALIVVAFALLGTVPLQEIVQHSREWPDRVIYGLRGAIEEGTEIVAILLLVAVTATNTRTLLARPGGTAFVFARYRGVILVAAAALAPVLIVATFVLPYPGGPADWLAAASYLGCALLVVRRVLAGQDPLDGRIVALLGLYVAASAGSNAIKLVWDPVVLGTPVGLRGLFVAALLVAAVPILRGAGRRANPLLFGIAAAAALIGSMWPHAQLLWCALPVLVALCVFAAESGVAAEALVASAAPGAMAIPMSADSPAMRLRPPV